MILNKENRSYPRMKINFKIDYTKKGDAETIHSKTHDISATGVSFISESILAPGDSVSLKILLEELGISIKAQAVVIRSWNESNHVITSVQFSDIDYHDFIRLLDYSLAFQAD